MKTHQGGFVIGLGAAAVLAGFLVIALDFYKGDGVNAIGLAPVAFGLIAILTGVQRRRRS